MVPTEPQRALEFRLFGAFESSLNGRALPPLRSRKEKWLLALLALRHDREIPRDWLAATFWPDTHESQGLFYLRKALSNLRQALGTEKERLLASATHTVRLDLSGAFCDVLAFDAALAEAAASPLPEEPLERAIALYRGPLLPDCQEGWAITERNAREQSYLVALERLATLTLEKGEPASAVRWLRRVLATEPFRESAVCSLMHALADSGDRAALQQVYQELRTRLHDDLHAAPAPETQALYRQLQQRPAQPLTLPVSTPAPSSSQRHLPVPLTELIGREPEIEEVTGWLRRSRLVTLVGPGGVGKTRLAIASAEAVMSRFPDGVWFVDLAPLTEAAYVPDATVRALGLQMRETGASPEEQLTEALGERTLLVVLDNCEHLVDACAQLTHRLLCACPELRILATSRQALSVTGEQVFPVPSMTLPPEREETDGDLRLAEKGVEWLLEFEAVRLFVERATQVNPRFRPDRAAMGDVVTICRRLDGIPLAIELAAARVSVLSVEAIQARLEHRFRLLRGGSRTALPRQQTLQAAIDWSYEHLTEQERLLLSRLSVFAGGWDLEATEAVCCDDQIEDLEVLDLLASLVGKSLVIAEEREGAGRYRLLETIREYAWQRLQQTGEETIWRARHLAYFLGLAEEAEPKLTGTEQAAWLERLERDHDDLRAALGWCRQESERAEAGLRLTGTLSLFWAMRGYLSEGREHLQAALSQENAGQRTPVRARALNGAGNLAWRQGDYSGARALYEEGLAISRELGDKQGTAGSLHNLGTVAKEQGDYSRARALCEEALGINREIGNRAWEANNLILLGNAAQAQGDYAGARALYEESLTVRREFGDKWGIANSLNSLGGVVRELGDYAVARTLYEECLAISRELGDKQGIASALHNLGMVANEQGDYAQGRVLLESALEINREIGNRAWEANNLILLGNAAQAQGDYAGARALYEEGLAIKRELGDKQGTAGSLHNLGVVANEQGDYSRARALCEEALGINREIGNRAWEANNLIFLGNMAKEQGDYAGARTLHEESLAIMRELGSKQGIAASLNNLGIVAYRQGNPITARAMYGESLRIKREIGDKYGTAYTLNALAELTAGRGQAEQAARFWGASQALREAIGSPLPPNEKEEYDLMVAEARTSLGELSFSAAWEQGRAMTFEQAIAYALEGDEPESNRHS